MLSTRKKNSDWGPVSLTALTTTTTTATRTTRTAAKRTSATTTTRTVTVTVTTFLPKLCHANSKDERTQINLGLLLTFFSSLDWHGKNSDQNNHSKSDQNKKNLYRQNTGVDGWLVRTLAFETSSKFRGFEQCDQIFLKQLAQIRLKIVKIKKPW